MPYPDGFSSARYDAAQGRDDAPDDASEIAAIRRALVQLDEIVASLRLVASSDVVLNNVCEDVSVDIEYAASSIRQALP